jgi:hypothetical protein
MFELENSLLELLLGIYGNLVGTLGQDLTNFFITALGIAVYGIIIGTFYKNFSKEKFFELKRKKGEGLIDEGLHLLAFIAKYTFAFPLITFVWFMFLTLFLVFLGTQGAAEVMYIAIAVVAATRITAYWDEEISEDLAKLLPIALLGYFLGNPSVLDAAVFEHKFFEITQVLPLSIPYFTYIIALEWSLRALVGIKDFVGEYKEKLIPAAVLSRIAGIEIPKPPKKEPCEEEKPSPAPKPKKKKKGEGEGWELGV